MSSVRKVVAVTKTATVQKVLRRASGATLAEITTVTTWQPHSARAYLSGLRKKGEVLAKEARRNGETAYRLESPVPAPAARKGKTRSGEAPVADGSAAA